MQHILRLTGMLLLPATVSFGALQFRDLTELSGQGLGAVPTVLTLHNTSSANLQGCVGWNGAADVFGNAGFSATTCTDGVTKADYDNSGPVQTAQSQTVLFSDPELNLSGTGLNASQIGVVYNSNQTSDAPITLYNITLRVYAADGSVIVSSAGLKDEDGNPVNQIYIPSTEAGVGSSGFLFTLDATQQALFNGALGSNWAADNRFALSLNTGCSDTPSATCAPNNDGAETLKIVNLESGSGHEVPEPVTMLTVGVALIALPLIGRRTHLIR